MRARGSTMYDLDLLHEILWGMTDSRGRLRVEQKDVVQALCMDQAALSKLFSKLVDMGRMRRMGRAGNQRMYQVFPPEQRQQQAESEAS